MYIYQNPLWKKYDPARDENLPPDIKAFASFTVNRYTAGASYYPVELPVEQFGSMEEIKIFSKAVFSSLSHQGKLRFFYKVKQLKATWIEAQNNSMALKQWTENGGKIVEKSASTTNWSQFKIHFKCHYFVLVPDQETQGSKFVEKEGDPSFLMVCSKGDLQAAKLLAERNPGVTSKCGWGSRKNIVSAFDCAVSSRNIEMMHWLYAQGVRPLMNSYSMALWSGDLILFKELMDNFPSLEVPWKDQEASKLFLEATLFGDREILQFLISKGADINYADDKKETALHLACKCHLNEIAAFLIENGADPSNTPFAEALDTEKQEAPLILENHEILEQPESGFNACAVAKKSPLALILENPDKSEREKIEWLKIVAADGADLNAKLLVEIGGKIHPSLGDGCSLLQTACLFSYPEMVKFLIEQVAEYTEFLPLIIFVLFPKTMSIVKRYEANSLLEPLTVYRLSYEKDLLSTLQVLLEHNPKLIHSKTPEGATFLEYAIVGNHSKEVIELLLPANFSLVSPENTLWSIICINGRLDLYDFFKELGFKDKRSLHEKLSSLNRSRMTSVLRAVLENEGNALLSLPADLLQTYLSPFPDVMAAYEPYDKGVFSRLKMLKRIAHAFALAGETKLAEKNFRLEGSGPYMAELLLGSFRKFLQQEQKLNEDFSENQLELLSEAASHALSITEGTEQERLLNAGKPVLLNSGHTGHVIGCVFFKLPNSRQLHVLVCNRGKGSRFYGISEIIFTPNDSLVNVLDALNTQASTKIDAESKKAVVLENSDMFWTQLISMGAELNQLKPLMEQFPQQNGTCQYDNLKGAIGALFYVMALQRGDSKEKAVFLMQKWYKRFTQFDRNDCLEDALPCFDIATYPKEMEFDLKFFQRLYDKILGDPRIHPKLVKKIKQVIDSFSCKQVIDSFS